MSTMVAAIYRCPFCKNEYDTADAADRCKDVPAWPANTALASRGHTGHEVFTVSVRAAAGNPGCEQVVTVRRHPAWRKQSHGWVFIGGKDPGGSCMYRPMTAAMAMLIAETAENEVRRLRRMIAAEDAKAKVLREWLAAQPAGTQGNAGGSEGGA